MVIYQVNKQKSYAQVNIKRMPKETIIIIIIIIIIKNWISLPLDQTQDVTKVEIPIYKDI